MSKSIALRGSKGAGMFAIIDDDDFNLVSPHKWCLHRQGYAVATINGVDTLMHRLIMNAKPGEEVDHRWPDRLLNSRENLRICTHQQNTWNTPRLNTTSGLRGVYWNGRGSSFSASVKIDQRRVSLGSYADPFDAAMAYNMKAHELYGEFAVLNNLDDVKLYDNLRVKAREASASTPLSARNKTGLRGIAAQPSGHWGAEITISNQHILICTCNTKEEAAYIFEQVAIQVRGDKAKLTILTGPSIPWPSQTVDAA